MSTRFHVPNPGHPPRDDSEKLNISLALLDGYSALSRFEKEYDLAAALAKDHPDSKRLFLNQASSLGKLGRYADADQLAKNWMAKQPDDLTGPRARLVNAVQREDYGLAHELAKNLLQSSRADAGDYNSAAWYGLFTGKPEDLDIASATKSLQMNQNNTGTLHTLGCLYAAGGRTAEAREVLLQAMELLNIEEPDSNYWYGFGRIAEQYGELTSAKEDYAKATPPNDPLFIPGSSYRLAQMRLTALKQADSTPNK